MNEATLPPSPNWYLSGILSAARDGTVAWGARNSIVVAKPRQDSKILRYSLIGNAHPDKVTCLAFSPEYGTDGKNLVISGGEEHIVRIWDLDTMSAVASQAYVDTKQKVVSVDWSKCDPDLVCFLSREGLLMSWTVAYNGCQLYSFGKLTATCLSLSPHKANVAAIGTKSGLVYIVNLQGNGSVTYKLRGHDVEVTSLSWCPTDENVLNVSDSESKGSKDMLLASGAKDRSVFVWRGGGDGRYQLNLPIPPGPMDSHQHRAKLPSSLGNWTAVCWAEPRLLLASSSWGELISWNLTMDAKNKPVCKLIHAHHARGLFCIANVPRSISNGNENWRERIPTTVWTLAQDRQVARSSLMGTESTLEYSVPTQGGYVYCMAACPLDTSRIAFGAGDAMLRVWNLSEPHETSFDVTAQWQKIMGKVRSIAWHPEKENLLAFGTGEGRVGVWDTNSSAKPPILYRQYHRTTVYSLGWGPHPDNKNFVLYSCGDNELAYYPSDKPNQEAKSIVKKGCTEFVWKPDYSCIVVGYEDGSISFMNRNLKEIGTPIYALKKAVQCLVWHPESTSTDLNLSALRNYLAIAINSSTVTILDFTDFMETIAGSNERDESSSSIENTAAKFKIVANLNGHNEKVVSLAWSSHFSGHLITASYDNTVQIWKVETQELIATYLEHTAPVQCCMWSPLDPDYAITGSSDFTLRVWKISEQKVVLPSANVQTKRVRTKKSKNKKVTKEAKPIVDVPEETSEIDTKLEKVIEVAKEEEQRTDAKTKRERLKKVSYLTGYTKRLSEKKAYVDSLRELVGKIRESKIATKNEKNDETKKIVEDSKTTILGSREEINTILEHEISLHTSQSRYNATTEMSLWNNSLRKNLQEATSRKRLNDFLVSLSAGLSMKTWQETCEAYATQLLFESNPTKAVAYLLSVHKIHRAIEVYIDQRMYKEAYVLARCRVDEEDPILKRILDEWANNASKQGNFEEVAQCCVKLGDFAKAARFLGRRKDIEILEVAVELGQLAEEPGLSESIAEQAFAESLLVSDIATARRLVDKFMEIRHRRAQIEVFEEMKAVRNRHIDSSTISSWLETGSNENLLDKLRLKCCDYRDDYNAVGNKNFDVAENEASLWLATSHYLAMYAIADNREKQLCHLANALGNVATYEIVHPNKTSDVFQSFFLRLIVSLESVAPGNDKSLFATDDFPVCKSLRAFLCFALLNWLADHSGELENLDDALSLVEKLLTDVLDERSVKYSTITNEINKLEASLASAIGKSQKAEDEEATEDTAVLLARLDDARNEKKLFAEERVCAPSPLLAFIKATQLSVALPDTDKRESFAKLVSETWTKVTS